MRVINVQGNIATVYVEGEGVMQWYARRISDNRVLLINEFKRQIGIDYTKYIVYKNGAVTYLIFDIRGYINLHDAGLEYVLDIEPKLRDSIIQQCYVAWIFYVWNISDKNMYLSPSLNSVVVLGESFCSVARGLTRPIVRLSSIFRAMGIADNMANGLRYLPMVKNLGSRNIREETVRMSMILNEIVTSTFPDLMPLYRLVSGRIGCSVDMMDRQTGE